MTHLIVAMFLDKLLRRWKKESWRIILLQNRQPTPNTDQNHCFLNAIADIMWLFRPRRQSWNMADLFCHEISSSHCRGWCFSFFFFKWLMKQNVHFITSQVKKGTTDTGCPHWKTTTDWKWKQFVMTHIYTPCRRRPLVAVVIINDSKGGSQGKSSGSSFNLASSYLQSILGF